MSPEESKVCGNADGFAECVQQSTGWLQFAENRVQWQLFVKTGKHRPQRNRVEVTVWQLQPPRGSKRTRRAGGTVVASNGVEWRRMVAPHRDEWWRRVATNGVVEWRRMVDGRRMVGASLANPFGCVVSANRSLVCLFESRLPHYRTCVRRI